MVAVLFVFGVHVPVMLLVDVVGSEMVPPEQIGAMALKAGTTDAPTPTVIVAVEAHCPVLGVKVYEVDPAVLVVIFEGFHVPVTLFEDVVNKLPGVAFRQYGPS